MKLRRYLLKYLYVWDENKMILIPFHNTMYTLKLDEV